MKNSDMGEGFQQGSRRIKPEEVGLIPEIVEMGEYMSLRRSFRRGSTT